MADTKKKIRKIIISVILVLIAYLVIDYVNIPLLIGVSPNNINVALFSIFFDTSIVLILYVISFYYIDNKQNEKDANARDTVDVLLNKTYQECLSNLNFLDNREMIGKYIMPKIDGNKTDSENKVVNNLQTLPFSSFDAIIDLASNGYVKKEKLNEYFDIKKEYQYLISVRITFFDLVNPQTPDQEAMYNDIYTRGLTLKSKLNGLINK
ncbi:MAG: hypothetical protein IJ397_06775 [Lachnospiraceae bacterium]|nr:hypothetical protein [Lachnospiraceae bacterium]